MSDLNQKTVNKKINFSGVGLHSGQLVKVTIKPSEPNTGIIFKRVDLKSNNLVIPNFSNVSNTSLNTTISKFKNKKKKPTIIIAKTIKGKGISFIENNPKWHHKIPNHREFQMCINELKN